MGAPMNIVALGTLLKGVLKFVDQQYLADHPPTPDLTPYEEKANKATDFSVVNNTKYPTVQAVQSAIDSAVAGLFDLRPSYDASGNVFPSADGSGAAGAIKKGDVYPISVAGTLGGEAVQIGDAIYALVDTPGQTAGNWSKLNSNISFVPESSIHDASAKSTPVDADEFGLRDSAASWLMKKITWSEIKTALWTAWGALIAAGTSKTTPVDADSLAISDSAASDATKKLTFTNLKAFLKTYFDTLYVAAGAGGGITLGTVYTLSGQASRTWTIPSTAKRFTVKVSAMSGSGGGTAPIQFRLGDAGGDETSGYLGAVAQSNSTSANLTYAAQTGFCVDTAAGAGGQIYYGMVTFEIIDPATNLWAMEGNISNPGFVMHLAGTKALSQALTQVTLIAPGTTFDGGTASCSSE
jgi:hypothetical protein